MEIQEKVKDLLETVPESRENLCKFLRCYYLKFKKLYIPFHEMDNIETVIRARRKLLNEN